MFIGMDLKGGDVALAEAESGILVGFAVIPDGDGVEASGSLDGEDPAVAWAAADRADGAADCAGGVHGANDVFLRGGHGLAV